MVFKKLTTVFITITVALALSSTVYAGNPGYNNSGAFYDDFNGDTLDTDKWLIAKKAWGGDNGGVVPENVSVSNGTLKLEGHGLNYTGDVKGVGKKRKDGTLTGACIATKEYYASGSYEVVAKVAPDLGACSAFWTFEYEEIYEGQEGYDPKYAMGNASDGRYCTVNHEIDIEIPTETSKNPTPNFSSARFNSFVRENDYVSKKYDIGKALNDGLFHTYRFDWHTGSTEDEARIDFFIDGVLLHTITTKVPTNESRFWIGVWFPASVDSDGDKIGDSGWAGKANIDTTVLEIDSVKITPFHEARDTYQHESYPNDGWAEPATPINPSNPDTPSNPDISDDNPIHNLIKNGSFSDSFNNWKISGGTWLSNGTAYLASGDNTDTISQTVSVENGATYTLSADITSMGSEIEFGVKDYNGRYTTYSEKYTKDGRYNLTFTVASNISSIEVFAEVVRYQKNSSNCSIDNITLVKGTTPNSERGYIVDGYSLDIKDGSFYLNIYADFPDIYSNYSMNITLPDSTVKNIKIKDANTSSLNGKQYKIFSVSVPAKDMYRTVSIVVYNENGQKVGDATNVSVCEYATALKTRNSSYATFIDAMLNYGAYAQAYFDDREVNSSSATKQYNTTDYSSIAQKITSNAVITTDGYTGTSLLLKNQVILRHYFSKQVSGATKNDEYYIVEQAFNPTQFSQTISGYNYSVNDYIKKVLTSNCDSKLKNLVCALYEYEEAANKLH